MPTTPVHTYLVTVVATHLRRETYSIQSTLAFDEIRADLAEDPFQLYFYEDVTMINDEFMECRKLNLVDVEGVTDV